MDFSQSRLMHSTNWLIEPVWGDWLVEAMVTWLPVLGELMGSEHIVGVFARVEDLDQVMECVLERGHCG